MSKKPVQQKQIARIENFFVFNAQYSLTAKEQKVILYLVSRLDPVKQLNLHEQMVPLRELKRMLLDSSKKNGSFYEEMQRFSDRIMEKRIEFQTNIEYEGHRLPGRVNWFQSITPMENEKGEVCLEFLFSEKLKPFLLELKEYTQIDYQETLSLTSGFSVRMFQVFRAHRDRMCRYEQFSKLQYSIEELKALLGVGNKYKDWRNFKRRVLEVMTKEINDHTSIEVKYKDVRKGRKVVGLEFFFSDTTTTKKSTEEGNLFEPMRLDRMSRSQQFAFDKLVAYGIRDGIAMEMLSRILSSEFRGFEDWYFEEVMRIFESKSKADSGPAKAGTLVKWFIEKKIFEQGDHFSKIMENLQNRKKKYEKEHPIAWSNRLRARDMTKGEFEDWYNKSE